MLYMLCINEFKNKSNQQKYCFKGKLLQSKSMQLCSRKFFKKSLSTSVNAWQKMSDLMKEQFVPLTQDDNTEFPAFIGLNYMNI